MIKISVGGNYMNCKKCNSPRTRWRTTNKITGVTKYKCYDCGAIFSDEKKKND